MKTILCCNYLDLPELRELLPDELREEPEDDERPLEDPLLRTLPELPELRDDDEPLLYEPREEDPEELRLERDGGV
jgi:hypothetical protein